MKKSLLFSLMACGAMGMSAQDTPTEQPQIVGEFYSYKLSPNGTWVVGDTSDEGIVVRNTQTGQEYYYEFCSYGTGNYVTDAGVVVGSQDDAGAIFKDGQVILPSVLAEKDMSWINGINQTCTKACGLMTNDFNADGYDGMMYVPVVFDVNADLTLSEPKVLPHPDKDFFGRLPQYSSASWISEDGKTIVGQTIDYSGSYIYPIVYTQGADGEWSYSFPSLPLFNPDKLPMPEFPGEFEDLYPDLVWPDVFDYMTPEELAAYNAQLEKYYETYDYELYPNYADYMTPEEIAAYNAASDAWNNAQTEYNEKIEAYKDQLDAIIDSSVFFEQNQTVLSTDGKTLLTTAKKETVDYENWTFSTDFIIYDFNLADGTNTIIPNDHNLMVTQITGDGTIIAATPMPDGWISMAPVRSYIRLAGSEQFIPIEEYVASQNPEYGKWMTENLIHPVEIGADEENDWAPIYEDFMFSGNVCVSDDLSVLAGAVLAFMYSEEYTYMTYIFTGLPAQSGIENVTVDNSEAPVEYYNLQGIRVNNPESGIYIRKQGNKVTKVMK